MTAQPATAAALTCVVCGVVPTEPVLHLDMPGTGRTLAVSCVRDSDRVSAALVAASDGVDANADVAEVVLRATLGAAVPERLEDAPPEATRQAFAAAAALVDAGLVVDDADRLRRAVAILLT